LVLGMLLIFLQDMVGPSWVFHIMKFTTYIVFNVFFLFVIWRHGALIYSTKRKLATEGEGSVGHKKNKRSTSSQKRRSRQGSDDEGSASEADEDEEDPLKQSDSFASASVREKRRQLDRLLWFYVVVTIISLVAIIFQIQAIQSSAVTKEDLHKNPLPTPSSVTSIIAFDVIQWAATALILFFFRNFNEGPSKNRKAAGHRDDRDAAEVDDSEADGGKRRGGGGRGRQEEDDDEDDRDRERRKRQKELEADGDNEDE